MDGVRRIEPWQVSGAYDRTGLAPTVNINCHGGKADAIGVLAAAITGETELTLSRCYQTLLRDGYHQAYLDGVLLGSNGVAHLSKMSPLHELGFSDGEHILATVIMPRLTASRRERVTQ